jgi:hypothetical protein
MDMTLSDGFLASYSCGVRLWVSYLTTVLFFGAIVTVAIVVIELMAQRKADPYGHAHSAIRPDPKAKTITVTLLAFVAASVLLLSLVIPLSRSRTRLFATETSIVETGCHVLTPYREVLDRNLVEFRYRYGRGNKTTSTSLSSTRTANAHWASGYAAVPTSRTWLRWRLRRWTSISSS